jgi:hypothetical protein
VLVIGTGPPIDQFTNADIVALWIMEDADNLFFNIQISGSGATTSTTGYTWTVHMTIGAEDKHASCASGADQPTPGDEATAAALADGVLTLTVPRSALGATTGVEITGIAVESNGNILATGVLAATDTAPDGGEEAGASYTVTGGGAAGPPGDTDGDGLNDTKEVEQFGGIGAQNGTGDPDGDGLNNTQEFGIGTNATKADTDGDGLNDKQDSAPLDPLKPGTGGNGTGNATADLDKDGLPDSWERTHFNSTTAQNGKGDPDQDGLDNAGEFAKGTDPNDADTDGDGLNDATDPKPLSAEATNSDRVEMYAGAPMFAAIATLCLFALARK